MKGCDESEPVIIFDLYSLCLRKEEEFIGFGTTAVRRQKTARQSSLLSQGKPSQAADHPPGTKPLIGKIIPKTPKPALIGKIVPRVSKEGQSLKESQVKVKETSKGVLKHHGKQVALTPETKHAEEHPSGRKADFLRRTGETSGSGPIQNQTAATSDESTKEDKLVSALAAVKGKEKVSKVKEQDGVTEDSERDQALSQKSVTRMRGFRLGHSRRTSQAVTLSFTSFHRRQRKRSTKDMGTSPEVGAEAGVQSGQEAAMPLEGKSINSSQKRTHKRHQRKSLYGYRRKPQENVPNSRTPKMRAKRTKHVFYTYEPETIPAQLTDTNEQHPNVTPSEDEPNSSAHVMTGRSSRVIKTPKRFLDEGMIPFPKGSLSTWLKTQQKEDEKLSVSGHESGYDGKSLQSDMSVVDTQSVLSKFALQPSPGTSHLEIYKNLKKLTLKLAEKKKGQFDTQGESTHDDTLTSHVRKRRRSKLMMEEMDSPGVVRKLAVVVNTDVTEPSNTPLGDKGYNSKDNVYYTIIIFFK